MALPRSRKRKFTDAEIDVLISEVTKQEHALTRQTSNLTIQEKYKIWFNIAEKVTAVSGLHRSITDVKRRWQDLRRRTKEKVDIARQSLNTNNLPSSSSSYSSSPATQIPIAVKMKRECESVCTPNEDMTANLNTTDRGQEQQLSGDPSPLMQGSQQSSDLYPLPSATSEPSGSHQQIQFSLKAEPPECVELDSSIDVTPNTELPRPCLRLKLQPRTRALAPQSRKLSIPRQFTSLSPFEEQLLAVHREQAAAIREGFRSMAQQNRLLYLEVCETNRNMARIASAVAEKAASSSGMAEELIRVQQTISASITSTNNLHARMIDMLLSQQEQPVLVLPDEGKGLNVGPGGEEDHMYQTDPC